MLDDDIDTLLARREPPIQALARMMVGVVREIRPDFAAKAAFGWNTVNFRHPKAGFICAVYPGRQHVSLIFQDGRLLDHPLLRDDGKVKRVRWMPFRPGEELPVDDIAILLAESMALRS